MLEQFFREPVAAQQHRGAPVVGPCLDGIAQQLAEAGYGCMTVRRYIYACEDFGRFLADRRLELRDVDEVQVGTFLNEVAGRRRTWCGVQVDAVAAVQGRRGPLALLVAQLRRAGIVATTECQVVTVESPHADVLDGYLEFLRRHRGIQEATIGQHRLHVGRFLQHISAEAVPIHDLTASQLDTFIVECGRRMARRSMGRVSAALRSFIRYLHFSGQIDHDLSPQIAMPRVYALETVPRALAWSDVLKLLCAPDRSTVAGRRDYAILVLLAVYGLRANEVVALSLEDVDWRRNQLRIRRSKGGGHGWYPLHPEVGEAIADYMRHGRPRIESPRIFFTLYAPVRPLRRSNAVGNVVMRQLRRAGIESPHRGTHTLRHSRAVHLLQQGFSLIAIGQLLGHRHPQSTFIYAKAALDDLRSVGLEVTEVVP
jgi:site-specific recombinase XerD